jgi:hypothetical protein
MTAPGSELSGRMPPDQIRYSQNSVSYRFRDGRWIDDLAATLTSGQISPDAVPPIQLMKKGAVWYTLDNRRLEAFRRAGIDVPFRLATAKEIESESWKFTTINEGVSVKVRGEPNERQNQSAATSDPRKNGSDDSES